MLKGFFKSQQRSGFSSSSFGGAKKKDEKIFINCENTFGAFSFARPETKLPFEPKISLSRFVNPFTEQKELFMRMDFASSFDGNLNTGVKRNPIDIVFVVDIRYV